MIQSIKKMLTLPFPEKLKIIGLAMLVTSILVATLAYTKFQRFESSAVISFSSSLSEYKNLREVLSDKTAYDNYATSDTAKKLGEIDISRRASAAFSQGVNLDWLKPIYRISKADAKEISVLIEDKDCKTCKDLIGLGIKIKAENTEDSAKLVNYLARYVTDAQIRDALTQQFIKGRIANKNLLERAESEKIKAEYEIKVLKNRLSELNRISQAYPAAARADLRPLMTLDKGGERFMPLPSQMAAVEAQIVDINESLTRSERNIKKSGVNQALIDEYSALAKDAKAGIELLDAVIAATKRKLSSLIVEYERDAALEQLNSFFAIRVTYVDQFKYISEPSMPTNPSNPTPLMLTLLAAFLAGLFATIGLFFFEIKQWLADRMESENV